MTKHTRTARGAISIALISATALVACKTTEPDDEGAGDLVSDWQIHGAVDPETIPLPPTAEMSGAEFLEMNKSKDGVVVLPSGLQYRILDEGNGKMPVLEDSVLVHYKMMNLQGKVLDNSRDYEGGKPQSFRLAKVIGGWREALVRMPEGSRWSLYIPPDLGYGSTGIASVGGNETLVYEIELFKVNSADSIALPKLAADGDISLSPPN